MNLKALRAGQRLRVEVTSEDNRNGVWTFRRSQSRGRIVIQECDYYIREPILAEAEKVLADLRRYPHTEVVENRC